TEVRGGNRFVALTWRANREADLREYRVWSNTDANQLLDVRRMPAATVAVQPGPTATYVDEGLVGLQTYYYRIAAVDMNGNVSAPSSIVSVRVADNVPPSPPAWERMEWVRIDSGGTVYAYDDPVAQSYAPAVALTWLADTIVAESVVERKSQFERV